MNIKTVAPKKSARSVKPRRNVGPISHSSKRNGVAQPQSARGYVRVIKQALANGAYLRARAISVEGARKFPDDTQLARYALVLGLPRVVRSEYAPDATIQADKTWVAQNRESYRGKWVALRNGTLLGAADSLQALLDAVGKDRETFYTKVF